MGTNAGGISPLESPGKPSDLTQKKNLFLLGPYTAIVIIRALDLRKRSIVPRQKEPKGFP